MRKISDLSKSELLNLIYHKLPQTVFNDHPVECACCGKGPENTVELLGETRTVYWFICDSCDEG